MSTTLLRSILSDQAALYIDGTAWSTWRVVAKKLCLSNAHLRHTNLASRSYRASYARSRNYEKLNKKLYLKDLVWKSGSILDMTNSCIHECRLDFTEHELSHLDSNMLSVIQVHLSYEGSLHELGACFTLFLSWKSSTDWCLSGVRFIVKNFIVTLLEISQLNCDDNGHRLLTFFTEYHVANTYNLQENFCQSSTCMHHPSKNWRFLDYVLLRQKELIDVLRTSGTYALCCTDHLIDCLVIVYIKDMMWKERTMKEWKTISIT